MKVLGDERKLGVLFSKAGCGGGQFHRNNLGFGVLQADRGFGAVKATGLLGLGFWKLSHAPMNGEKWMVAIKVLTSEGPPHSTEFRRGRLLYVDNLEHAPNNVDP